MTPEIRNVLLAFLLLAPAFALAAEPAPPPSLGDLAWLAGSWQGRAGEIEQEEVWTAPKGGMMLGLHRDVRPGGRAFFEFLRIEEQGGDGGDGGIVYLASPSGRSPATPFRLVRLDDHEVTFENPEHDFPQRVIYRLERAADGGETLVARVEGTVDGEERHQEWRWRRAAPAGD